MLLATCERHAFKTSRPDRDEKWLETTSLTKQVDAYRGVEGTKVKGEMWKFIPAGYISPGSLLKKYLHVDVTNSVAQL